MIKRLKGQAMSKLDKKAEAIGNALSSMGYSKDAYGHYVMELLTEAFKVGQTFGSSYGGNFAMRKKEFDRLALIARKWECVE